MFSSDEVKLCNDSRKERKVFQTAVKQIYRHIEEKFVLDYHNRSDRKQGRKWNFSRIVLCRNDINFSEWYIITYFKRLRATSTHFNVENRVIRRKKKMEKWLLSGSLHGVDDFRYWY